MKDKKKLMRLKQSSEVLSHLLTPSVILRSEVNNWCSLTFTNSDNKAIDYCTLFAEEQIKVLERVNQSIQEIK
jgi:ferritin